MNDDEHLRLLSIFHYVAGGLAVAVSLIPIIHIALGTIMISKPEAFSGNGAPPPPIIGWIFVLIGAAIMAGGFFFAGIVIACGRLLAKRRRYVLCFVIAGIECLFVPFGTILGVFTIIVLSKDSVKAKFDERKIAGTMSS